MKSVLFLLVSLVMLSSAHAADEGGKTSLEVGELEDLVRLHQRECLPKGDMTEDEVARHYRENGVSEDCYRYMVEIDEREKKLEALERGAESSISCEGGQCQALKLPGVDLGDLAGVGKKLSCNEAKKSEVDGSCGDDVKCALLSSAMLVGGYAAEKLLPEGLKVTGCHYGNDSCATRLAAGFLKALVSFFGGAWDLLKSGVKAAGGLVKKKAKQFWNWVRGADDHASTSQLAMAKASEDEGVFQMLRKDFTGTLSKIFSGLIASIKEWLKNDVFCEKWEGTPQFSKCERPMEGIDCLSCKAIINGVCSMAGTVLAEIVPSFLTGGLLSAAKHGAGAAGKIAKLFKVSAKTREGLKASRISKLVISGASKLGNGVVRPSLKIVKSYLISPARTLAKKAHRVFLGLGAKWKLFLAETKGGKVLVFSGKVLKKTATVAIYPIDNPMTTWAFKKGESSFAKLLTLGPPKLNAMTAASAAIVKFDPKAEALLAKLEAARVAPRHLPHEVAKLEGKLVKVMGNKRIQMLDEALGKGMVDLKDLIRHLYPELQYGKLAQKVGSEGVLRLEQELLGRIESLPDLSRRERLRRQFEQYVFENKARQRIVVERAGKNLHLEVEGKSVEAPVPKASLETKAHQKTLDEKKAVSAEVPPVEAPDIILPGIQGGGRPKDAVTLRSIVKRQNTPEIRGNFGECCLDSFKYNEDLAVQEMKKGIADPSESPYFVGRFDNMNSPKVRFEGEVPGYQYVGPEGIPSFDFKKEFPGLDEFSLPAFEMDKTTGKLTSKGKGEVLEYIKRNLPNAAEYDFHYVAQGGFNIVFKACPKKAQGICLPLKLPAIDIAKVELLEKSMKDLEDVKRRMDGLGARLKAGEHSGKLRAELADLTALKAKITDDVVKDIKVLDTAVDTYRMDLMLAAKMEDTLSPLKGPRLNGEEFLTPVKLDRNPELLKKGMRMQGEFFDLVAPPGMDEIRQGFAAAIERSEGTVDDWYILKYFGKPDEFVPDAPTLNEFIHFCSKATLKVVIKYCDGMKAVNNIPSAERFTLMLKATLKTYHENHMPIGTALYVTFNKARGNPVGVINPKIDRGRLLGEPKRLPVGFDPLEGQNIMFDRKTGMLRPVDA